MNNNPTVADIEQKLARLQHLVYHQIQDRNAARANLDKLEPVVAELEDSISWHTARIQTLNAEIATAKTVLATLENP